MSGRSVSSDRVWTSPEKGGDLDLVVESERGHGILEKADLKIALERVLGLPVDVLLITRNGARSVFERMALSKSQPLP